MNSQITGFPSAKSSYALYGQTVFSEYPLPLPPLTSPSPNISVYFDGFISEKERCEPDVTGRSWAKVGSNYRLRYFNRTGHMTQFLLNKKGTAIRISQSWREWRDTLFLLLNPALAAAISLQGMPVLHASSLVWKGSSYLIMGNSGAGKSTLSAALAAEGMSIHSDDITVCNHVLKSPDDETIHPLIAPGYPRIKVNPDLPAILGIPDASLLPVFITNETHADLQHGNNDQSHSPLIIDPEKWLPADQLPGGFYPHTAPLKAIFILSERKGKNNSITVDQLLPVEGSIALTEHIYGRDWLNPPALTDLAICTRISKNVPVYRISLPDDLLLLEKSAQLLLKGYIRPQKNKISPSLKK